MFCDDRPYLDPDLSRSTDRAGYWADSEQVRAWGRELLAGRWRVVERHGAKGRLALLLGAPTRLLTTGEQQVLYAFVQGFCNKRIALELGLAFSTVSQRLANATAALGFVSRAELLWCTARALAHAPPAARCGESSVSAMAVELSGERRLLFHFTTAEAHLPEVLTRAEREVVHGVLAGKTNAAIAAARGASRHTIANQLAKIYKKLAVGSRWELMTRCQNFGVPGLV
jgi:DNA-binding NarL/FixJ family response regulator